MRLALVEKGLKWDSRLLALNGDQFDSDYLALNPAAVVPTLVHDGRVVIESTVIMEYLEDAFPERPLRPTDPWDSANARRLMMKLDSGEISIHLAASVLTYAIANRHNLIAEAGGLDSGKLSLSIDRHMNAKSRHWLEDAVFNGIKSKSFRQAIVAFDDLLNEFETLLGQTTWLTGDRYSISDTSFTPYLIRLDLLQLDILWRDRPRVSDWYAKIWSRPSISTVADAYDTKNRNNMIAHGSQLAKKMEALVANARSKNC